MKNKDILFFGILILCLIAVLILISIMMSERSQCLKNPFVYGASHMKGVECTCYQQKSGGCPARFTFNDTGINFSLQTFCGGFKG